MCGFVGPSQVVPPPELEAFMKMDQQRLELEEQQQKLLGDGQRR